MRISFSHQEKVFVAHAPLSRGELRQAGFLFNPILERFESSRFKSAAALRSYFDSECKKIFERISCLVLEPWSGGISIPTSQKLDPVQKKGVLDALERNHFYIAFEQGIGKTPTALAVMNSYREKTLILSPPHLIPMWEREIKKWATNKPTVDIATGFWEPKDADITLCPDSTFGHPIMMEKLKSLSAKLLIVEEAQRFVNPEALRTQALFGPESPLPQGLVHQFDKTLFLSGTPMPNRPMELYPILRAQAANLIDFQDKESFGVKYCAGFLSAFGWDFKGSSNEEILRRKIHTVFMRREEKGKEFAEKTQQTVFFKGFATPKIRRLEETVLANRPLKDFIKEISHPDFDFNSLQKLTAIVRYRSAVAARKLPITADWVKNILTTTNESVLVLGWHNYYIGLLSRRLENYFPEVITGSVPHRKREAKIQKFQSGGTRLLLGNIGCMVGYNIPKATRVVFFEVSWTPKDNDQAMDRAHRRGSTERVLVDFLVLTDTLEEYILAALLKKKRVIDKIITKQRREKCN